MNNTEEMEMAKSHAWAVAKIIFIMVKLKPETFKESDAAKLIESSILESIQFCKNQRRTK